MDTVEGVYFHSGSWLAAQEPDCGNKGRPRPRMCPTATRRAVMAAEGIGFTICHGKGFNQRDRAALIFLCGAGDNGNAFCDLAHHLAAHDERLKTSAIEYVFLDPPNIHFTAADGAPTHAWFDQANGPITAETETIDRKRLHKSVEMVLDTIRKLEARGISPHRIIVAGYSQGGAVALHTAYGHVWGQGISSDVFPTLGGCVSLSGWIPCKGDISIRAGKPDLARGAKTPLWWAHGKTDDKVLCSGVRARFRELIHPRIKECRGRIYRMGHTMKTEEVGTMANFVADILFPRPASVDSDDEELGPAFEAAGARLRAAAAAAAAAERAGAADATGAEL